MNHDNSSDLIEDVFDLTNLIWFDWFDFIQMI